LNKCLNAMRSLKSTILVPTSYRQVVVSVGSPAGVGIVPLDPSGQLVGSPSGGLGASLASGGSGHAGQVSYRLPVSLVVGDYFTPMSGSGRMPSVVSRTLSWDPSADRRAV